MQKWGRCEKQETDKKDHRLQVSRGGPRSDGRKMEGRDVIVRERFRCDTNVVVVALQTLSVSELWHICFSHSNPLPSLSSAMASGLCKRSGSDIRSSPRRWKAQW